MRLFKIIWDTDKIMVPSNESRYAFSVEDTLLDKTQNSPVSGMYECILKTCMYVHRELWPHIQT